MSAANAQSPLLTQKTPDGPIQTATTSSQSPGAATGVAAPKPLQTNTSPINPPPPRKAETTMSWGSPAGLPIPNNNNENLLIFRRALGINTHRDAADASGTVEEGRKTAIGIYRTVVETQTRMIIQYALLTAFLYLVYFAQIIIGAALTSIGATATGHEKVITILGALNTVLAGLLALIKGSGQPQKLGKDRIGYRRLQDWIEETEALLAVGVIGRNRKEVGLLVESAFKRYNAAKASEENNDPDFYVYHQQEPIGNRPSDDGRKGNESTK
ncbi:hypothetical protein E0Z10_g7383 [Xylaria hypoxylon]|uniref:SMODS and SLOG-associating 2TM effector domain-containing protein n=1 Tax=Xylaria hypoxylon TaxID=37992 RepID=A0A4Z0YAY9_9PEZI|nr:hypothetical protein E0Z10_g7383 [Xylaria hypoxylon]